MGGLGRAAIAQSSRPSSSDTFACSHAAAYASSKIARSLLETLHLMMRRPLSSLLFAFCGKLIVRAIDSKSASALGERGAGWWPAVEGAACRGRASAADHHPSPRLPSPAFCGWRRAQAPLGKAGPTKLRVLASRRKNRSGSIPTMSRTSHGISTDASSCSTPLVPLSSWPTCGRRSGTSKDTHNGAPR